MGKNLITLMLICAISEVAIGGYFTIIGPETVYPGSEYRATLASTDYEITENLKVTLLSEYDDIVSELYYILKNKGQQDIRFNIPSFENASYTLRANYLSSVQKVFESKIKVIGSKFSIFVQTDKPIYRPGDNVQYRVLVLDAEMKPYQYKKLNIAFTDGEKKTVSRPSSTISEMGFYENSLRLADELNAGKWGIHVRVDDNEKQIAIQNFIVSDYQLPKFEVFIEPIADHVVSTNPSIKVKVYAKYFFGKGHKFVKGKATVVATVYESGNLNKELIESRKIVNVLQKEDVTFVMRSDLKIYHSMARIIKFQATFEDNLMKKTATAESFVVVNKNANHRFELFHDKEFFTPGSPFTLQVIVRKFDGSILLGNRIAKVMVRISKYKSCPPKSIKYDLKTELMETVNVSLINGVANFTTNVPEYAQDLIFGVHYENSFRYEKFKRIATKSQENIDLSISLDRLKTDQTFTVQITGTHEINEVYSIVIGRNGIIDSKMLNAYEVQTMQIKYKLTPAMLPTSSFIVYYIHHSGEVVFNQIKVDFHQLLSNFLDLELVSELVEPNANVSIIVKTSPSSYVALLAVDQKISNPKKTSNDISEGRIRKNIKSLSYSNVFLKRNESIPYFLLSDSNVFLMTDADKGEPDCTKTRTSDDTSNDEHYIQPQSNDSGDISLPELSSYEAPETWIFKSFQVGNDGRYVLKETVPDSMTSYVISGFSVHSKLGLGIAEPIKVGTFKRFFVELNIPNYVVIGEIVKVEVFVYNYVGSQSRQYTTVTLNNDDKEFEFWEPNYDRKHCRYVLKNSNSIEIETPANAATVFNFYVKPIKSGLMAIKVQAESKSARDVTKKMINVAMVGLKSGQSQAKFFDLRSRKYDSFYADFQPEDKAIKSSIQSQISIVGDLMGPVLENTENLLDLPLETTEQRLFKFMPTVVALRYLQSVNRLSSSWKNRGIRSLESSFQYIVSKRLSGENMGAFSVWNKPTSDGHVATTAYVVKYLGMIKEWINIQEEYIVDGLNYLKRKQQQNGQFIDEDISDEVISSDHSSNIVLTAYVTISILENTHYIENFSTVIRNALKFLNDNFNSIKDSNYALAISSYALALGKNEAASKFLDELKENAITESDKTYWKKNGNENISPAIKIEIASYAILAYDKLERTDEATNILNWLLTQKNQLGGFSSPKDTVVALQAIAVMAKRFYSDKFNMNLYFFQDESVKKGVHINRDNALKVFQATFPSSEGVSIQANGTGVALVQVWQEYYLKPEGSDDKFIVEINHSQTQNSIELEVCVSMSEDQPKRSKVTVAEVSLPSGFEFDDSKTNEIKAQGVLKVSAKKRKSVVNLTFEKITDKKTCVDVKGVRMFTVASTALFAVKVYEFDEKERFTAAYYIASPTLFCEASSK